MCAVLAAGWCRAVNGDAERGGVASPNANTTRTRRRWALSSHSSRELERLEFLDRLVAAAVERTRHEVRYDPTYFRIAYPGGDVPEGVGVCTDEVIRPYRAVGVDLQREVHEDMARNFRLYPKKWGLSRPDTNIDHRRVPNLMVFFSRKGASLPVTDRAPTTAPATCDVGPGRWADAHRHRRGHALAG